MTREAKWTTLSLETLHTLPVCSGVGAKIVCLSGELWITQEGDARDFTLGPGQVFTIDRKGLVLAHATRRSVLRVQDLDRHSVSGCVEAAARRMRSAVFADLWQRFRTRVLGLAA